MCAHSITSALIGTHRHLHKYNITIAVAHLKVHCLATTQGMHEMIYVSRQTSIPHLILIYTTFCACEYKSAIFGIPWLRLSARPSLPLSHDSICHLVKGGAPSKLSICSTRWICMLYVWYYFTFNLLLIHVHFSFIALCIMQPFMWIFANFLIAATITHLFAN